MSKELSKIRQIKYLRYIEEKDKFGQMAKKMIVPKFFSMISDFNEYRVFEKFDTPLDILQEVLVFENAKYKRRDQVKEFKDLLIQAKDLEGRYQQNSADAIFKIVSDCGKRINGLKLKTCTLKEKAKKTVERKSKQEAIKNLKELNTNTSTILSILKQCFCDEEDKFEFKKYSMLTLNLLFTAKKLQVLMCFKNNNISIDEVLVKIKDEYDYDIFGNKYQKMQRKELNL
jgi:hypothetical protein